VTDIKLDFEAIHRCLKQYRREDRRRDKGMKRALIAIRAAIAGKPSTMSEEKMHDLELSRLDKRPQKTAAEDAFHQYLKEWKEKNSAVIKETI